MPVLIIAAAYALLFKGGGESGGREDRTSFLDPRGLRERLSQALPEGAPREDVLRHTDELALVATSYGATVRASLERYAAHTASGEFSTASILELLAPSDRAGLEAMQEVVRIRQAILERLSSEDWQAVFG